MPRRNKPHSERRRKTKNYRNKNTKFEQEPKQKRYESLGNKYEDEGWEEWNDKEYGRKT